MLCQTCQRENPADSKFCNQCGNALQLEPGADNLQRSFDEQLSKIQRYLPQGLTKKILSQRDHIEGERRQVTVMFCDMEGFTPLVERLGAEAAYTVMGQIYEILIRQVHDYEGTINEMTGDGIMALFGAPIALEEGPQRALWAARAIHKEIAVFNRKKKELGSIRMRIGIHSGPVVVGSLGNDLRVEFKAVGDTVNLASRMERLAVPGTTYVTPEVFKQAQGMFEFEDIGKKEIKGKDEAIRVFKVLPGHKDIHRPQLGSERMIFSEMVGRKRKLDKLELQVMKLVNGEGSIVNIVGEAGIGKSRLLAELKEKEVIKRTLLLEGRAVSMGRNLSFHPMIDLLRQWAKIGVDDSVAEAYTKLETTIRRFLWEDTREVLPFIATLMGLRLPSVYRDRLRGIEGEALEKMIRKNMRMLFSRMSDTKPLIIVMDDLHWADKSSIELLQSLYRLSEKSRVLFVNIFRPGYAQTGRQVIETLETTPSLYHVDIQLRPLDDRNSETLITNMLNLRSIHHNVMEQIVQRAGGNPYFIEEVVRSFIDQGAVVIRNGKFEITPKFSQVTIPDTINDVLMARFDRLEEETRDLLKVAAVIGRSFFYRVLAKVASAVQDLDQRLSFLKETQLIQERRRMEELEYLFSHALAQEAAYASILPNKRKILHLKVASTIENIFAEKLHDFYGMLAYHYSRAENMDKSEEMLIKAGEAALKTSASSEALTYYLEALNLYRQKSGELADKSKIALLEKNIALALYNRGQYEEAMEYFDRTISYYWGKLPQHPIVLGYKLLDAYIHFQMALYMPALKFRSQAQKEDIDRHEFVYKKCKALSIINPQRFFIESIYICKELSKYKLSEFEQGLKIFVGSSSLFSFTGISFRISRKILKSSRKYFQEDSSVVPTIYYLMETIHNYLSGDWEKPGQFVQDLVQKRLEEGEIYLASQLLFWNGCPCIFKGDLEQAQIISEALSNIANVYENDLSILLNHMLRLKLFMERRLLNQAIQEVDKGIEFAKRKGFTITLLDFFSSKARIYVYFKEKERADELMKRADEIKSSVRAAPIQLSIYFRNKLEYLLCDLENLLLTGTPSEISLVKLKVKRVSQNLIKTTKRAAQHRTEAYKLMGVYYWLSQKPEVAMKWFGRAIQEGERLGARLELARTYFQIGRRLLQSGGRKPSLKGIEAEEYLKRSKSMFEHMNLKWDLEHFERLGNQ